MLLAVLWASQGAKQDWTGEILLGVRGAIKKLATALCSLSLQLPSRKLSLGLCVSLSVCLPIHHRHFVLQSKVACINLSLSLSFTVYARFFLHSGGFWRLVMKTKVFQINRKYFIITINSLVDHQIAMSALISFVALIRHLLIIIFPAHNIDSPQIHQCK